MCQSFVVWLLHKKTREAGGLDCLTATILQTAGHLVCSNHADCQWIGFTHPTAEQLVHLYDRLIHAIIS